MDEEAYWVNLLAKWDDFSQRIISSIDYPGRCATNEKTTLCLILTRIGLADHCFPNIFRCKSTSLATRVVVIIAFPTNCIYPMPTFL